MTAKSEESLKFLCLSVTVTVMYCNKAQHSRNENLPRPLASVYIKQVDQQMLR